MITKETASAIARVYRDLEEGAKILGKINEELAQHSERVGFHGELQSMARCCKLEWPSSESSYTVYNVEPEIARAVIIAHLADQNAKLDKLNAVAALEIGTQGGE